MAPALDAAAIVAVSSLKDKDRTFT